MKTSQWQPPRPGTAPPTNELAAHFQQMHSTAEGTAPIDTKPASSAPPAKGQGEDATGGSGPHSDGKPDGPSKPGAFRWNGDEREGFDDAPWKLLCCLWDREAHKPRERVAFTEAYASFGRKAKRKKSRVKPMNARRSVAVMAGKLNDQLLALSLPFVAAFLLVGGDEIALKSSNSSLPKDA